MMKLQPRRSASGTRPGARGGSAAPTAEIESEERDGNCRDGFDPQCWGRISLELRPLARYLPFTRTPAVEQLRHLPPAFKPTYVLSYTEIIHWAVLNVQADSTNGNEAQNQPIASQQQPRQPEVLDLDARQLVDRFLAEAGIAPTTKATYKRTLAQFLQWHDARGWGGLARADVLAYKQYQLACDSCTLWQ